MEGVHFDLAYTSLAQLGWKSLTVNLSDIAAMGGDPGPALLSLGWPPDRDRSLALEFAAGLAQAAREYGVAVIGGDTVASPGGLIVTVTLTGRVPAGQMLRRAGAGVGDLIFVTGPLGEAAAGLEILRQGLELPPDLQEALTEAHLRPRPQLRAGRLLAARGPGHGPHRHLRRHRHRPVPYLPGQRRRGPHPRRRGPRLAPGYGRGPASGLRPPGPGPLRRRRLSPLVHRHA